jgi:hypothetical protein
MPVGDFTAGAKSPTGQCFSSHRSLLLYASGRVIVERSADAGFSIPRHPEQILAFTPHRLRVTILSSTKTQVILFMNERADRKGKNRPLFQLRGGKNERTSE